MKSTTIGGKLLYVVGDFFSYGGEVGGKLKASYTGPEAHAWLSAAFMENAPEDYDSLSNHPDPSVRLLVVRNLESLDNLLNDSDHTVKRAATLASAATGNYHLFESQRGMLWNVA